MSWNNNAEEDEFDGDLTALQAAAAKSKKGGMTRLEELEHEMKLLSWHKLANEAALKAAIIRTKNLKKHDKLQMQKDRNRERAAWMEQIIREEQMKPLEVNTHFVQEYEAREKHADAALERTIEHHLHNLRKLKQSIEDKDKIRQRKEKFYAKREEVRARIASRAPVGSAAGRGRNNKQQQQSGPGSRAGPATSSGSSSPVAGAGGGGGGGGGGEEEAPGQTPAAAALVVGSLDKLLQLERRINQLEESVQEKQKMEKRTAGALSQLGMLRFRRKKIEASLRSPAKTRFAVSMHSANNPTHPENFENDEEEDDGDDEVGGQAKVNNWMAQRKQQLKEQRRKRERLALKNRQKARQMGSRSARSVAADFKSMQRNDPRHNRGRKPAHRASGRGGAVSLPPINNNARRRQAW